MKNTFKVVGIIALLVVIAFFTSTCEMDEDFGDNGNIAVTGITFSKTTMNLLVGGTQALSFTIAPSNATNNAVTWKSSIPAIASVSSTGVVTAVAPGNSIITVTTVDGNKTASCIVSITSASIAVKGVTLDETSMTLSVGGNEILYETITPEEATNKNVTWSSSNPAVASVTNGVVIGVSVGSATITVTTVDGNKKATCKVTVTTASSIRTFDSVSAFGKWLSIQKVNTYRNPYSVKLNVSDLTDINYVLLYDAPDRYVFIDLSESTTLKEIPPHAFCIEDEDENGNLIYDDFERIIYVGCYTLTKIILPNSVTSIGEGAFQNCDILASVNIPNSVTKISDSAFLGCVGIASLTLPTNVKNIGKYAFENCNSLVSINIPNGITTISDSAFFGCFSLPSITIPSSVTSIEDWAFEGCSSLANITIPNSVEIIGEGAFVDCTSLISVIIPNSVKSIGQQAFIGCSSLTSITIPNSVTNIGIWAFSECTSLTNITIGSSVESIEYATFYGCTSLSSVIIPNSVKSIEQEAFRECTSLYSVTIGSGVTSIEYATFFKCTSLYNVTIGSGVTSIGQEAFSDCTILSSITIPNSVTSIGESAFRNCTSLYNITIGSGVTSIGNNAFRNCTSLASLTMSDGVAIPASVKSIGDSAFYECTSIPLLIIPDSVTSIGKEAFRGCTNLGKVTIGSGITSIEESVFYYCTRLTSITIPANITNISQQAFDNCTNLVSVTFDGTIYSGQFNTNSPFPGNLRTVFYSSNSSVGTPRTYIRASGSSTWSGNVDITDITLSKTSTSIVVGGTEALTATITPADATNQNVTWSSSDNSIASVSSNGVVNGVAPGSALITVTTVSGNITAACSVTVTVPVTNVTLNKTSANLLVGGTEVLTATVLPSNATNQNVTWSSSNNTVASVSSSGMVSAVSVGDAIITVTTADGKKTAACSITVSPISVTGITINKASTSLLVGGTETLSATVAPYNATNQNVIWGTSDSSVVSVTSNGVITGEAEGNAVISVTTSDGNMTDTCAVIVSETSIAVTDVSMSKTSTSIVVGSMEALSASIAPSTATNQNVSWSSDNNAVATVTASGQVTGISVGNAVITVTTVDGDKTAACSITVLPVSVTGVTLNKTSASIIVGNTETLSATVTPSNAMNKSITWSSSNSAIATVSTNGLVTGIAVGSAVITITTVDGSKTATCSITVLPVSVTGVTLNKTSVSLIAGKTETLIATVSPSNATNKTVTWSSSNTAVATVSSSGVVTGVAAGSATITVITSDGNRIATCAITVIAATVPVTGVSLNKTSLSLNSGGIETLFATVTPSNATNQNVTWSSSNSAVATVSSSGEVIAVAAGSAAITVVTSDGNRTATCSVSVTTPVVSYSSLASYLANLPANTASSPYSIIVSLGRGDRIVRPGGIDYFSIISAALLGNPNKYIQLGFEGSLTDIPDDAFYDSSTRKGCTTLVGVTIPSSVSTIGDAAFAGTGLVSVTFLGTIPSGGFSSSARPAAFPGDLREKFYATGRNGTPGTYTRVGSTWTRQ